MGPEPAVAQVRAAVRRALSRLGAAEPALTVFVACSGGADSLALAAATAFEARRAGVAAGLITVDHALQPGSADRARRVGALGAELGLDPVHVVAVQVGATGGPEAAARTARYAAFDRIAAAGGGTVLLGHTLDDQAETVLLGLGRGSGPRSIAGMRAFSGHYARPLLDIRRVTTAQACAALGLPVWDDPHNTDLRFQRVRLRAEVLPLLEDVLQGGVSQALARTAKLLQDDLDALDALAEQAAHDCAGPADASPGLEVSPLVALPRAVRTRVLRAWALGCGAVDLSAAHLGALDLLVTDWHGQGPLDLPGGVSVSRASGRLLVDRPRERHV